MLMVIFRRSNTTPFFPMTRTLTQVPDIYTPEEWNEIKNKYYIHEKGTVCLMSNKIRSAKEVTSLKM